MSGILIYLGIVGIVLWCVFGTMSFYMDKYSDMHKNITQRNKLIGLYIPFGPVVWFIGLTRIYTKGLTYTEWLLDKEED